MKSISFWWQLESIHLLHSFGGCGGETKESGVNPRYHSKQHTKSERLETGNQTLSPALLLSASPQRPAEQKETWTWGGIRALCCVRFEGKKRTRNIFFLRDEHHVSPALHQPYLHAWRPRRWSWGDVWKRRRCILQSLAPLNTWKPECWTMASGPLLVQFQLCRLLTHTHRNWSSCQRFVLLDLW